MMSLLLPSTLGEMRNPVQSSRRSQGMLNPILLLPDQLLDACCNILST